ncbi:hypothetical protein ElyMa_000550800 [Elysia marginata]|uniref:Helitron helicase-like domain-containing protein n=1 Tax=Elysia marginata TaxID=1093978 RepID=A0AAV4G1B6_9GAST|nr:hypothetical protein ElyMa_000550800 [Elysia marginata]
MQEQQRQRRLAFRLEDENQASTRPRKNNITTGAARLIDTVDFSNNEATYASKHRCGLLNIECPHCSALRWQLEKPTFCCQGGKIKIENPPPPPQALIRFLQDKHVLSTSRAYNNALAMASIGCNEIRQNGFSPTFTVQGKLHHSIGSLLPVQGNEPKFAQIFFVD